MSDNFATARMRMIATGAATWSSEPDGADVGGDVDDRAALTVVLAELNRLRAQASMPCGTCRGDGPAQWTCHDCSRAAARREQQLETQLAGCGVAAIDGGEDVAAEPGSFGYSQSYADVLSLRRRFEALQRELLETQQLCVYLWDTHIGGVGVGNEKTVTQRDRVNVMRKALEEWKAPK